MRPVRLDMEGFLAYRQRTTVDFRKADLFVLSGPTGSGKSSVIDAMTFALYGSIPRLEHKGLIEPVINATADRARVMFEFSIGDDVWQVARSLNRTKEGAKADEVRLQRGDDEIYSGREVTPAVSELLGLDFDQFTKAVVLPQGAFARFLTDKPSERQDLLRALLDLGIFEEIKVMANQRAAGAGGRAESLQEGLDKLQVPTKAEVAEAKSRSRALEEAIEEMPGRIETLQQLESKALESGQAVESLRARLQALEKISPPDQLDSLNRDLKEAKKGWEMKSAAVADEEKAMAELEERLDRLGDIAQLRQWAEASTQLEELHEAKTALDLEYLEATAARSEEQLVASRETVDQLVAKHAAHGLREGLGPGDMCPVCEQRIEHPLQVDEETLGALAEARKDHASAEHTARNARDRLAQAQGRARQLEDDIAKTEVTLADAPTTLPDDLSRATRLEEEHRSAYQRLGGLRAEMVSAREHYEETRQKASRLRDQLVTARDSVGTEGPPLPSEDVLASWAEFTEWRGTLMNRLSEQLPSLEKAAADGQAGVADERKALAKWLERLDIPATDRPETELALAEERAKARVTEFEAAIAEAAEMSEQLTDAKAEAAVAASLGNHLKSNNFEAWVMEEALEVLIEGANRMLLELAGGAYSLATSAGHFEIVDHRNADQVRPVKSLSGGEVFLVSLALALSMASQLAELTSTPTRLESIFLDEGFGSLDSESLDTVASVLDELVGRGRTVGIVTHVKELSDRIPIRFEVSKGPVTAAIQRVDP